MNYDWCTRDESLNKLKDYIEAPALKYENVPFRSKLWLSLTVKSEYMYVLPVSPFVNGYITTK